MAWIVAMRWSQTAAGRPQTAAESSPPAIMGKTQKVALCVVSDANSYFQDHEQTRIDKARQGCKPVSAVRNVGRPVTGRCVRNQGPYSGNSMVWVRKVREVAEIS
jgi:hypothetical protein